MSKKEIFQLLLSLVLATVFCYFLVGFNFSEPVDISIHDTILVVDRIYILVIAFLSVLFFMYLFQLLLNKQSISKHIIFIISNALLIACITKLIAFTDSLAAFEGNTIYPPLSAESTSKNNSSFFSDISFTFFIIQILLIVILIYFVFKASKLYVLKNLNKNHD